MKDKILESSNNFQHNLGNKIMALHCRMEIQRIKRERRKALRSALKQIEEE